MKVAQAFSWPRRVANWLRLRLWWFAAGGFLLLAVWVVVLRQLLVMTPSWRGDLESLIEQRIQTPVTIGAISGHVSGLSPVFVLEDLVLSGEHSDDAGLRLGRVELTVDVLPSLLSRSLRARALTIRDVELQLQVNDAGKIHLKGVEAIGGATRREVSAIQRVLEILYRQKRIQLHQGRARLQLADGREVRIDNLSFLMTSSGPRHRLALNASSDQEQASLDLRLDLRGDAYRRDQLNGRGYVKLDVVGAQSWLQDHWPLDVGPESVHGSFEGWLSIVRGEVLQSTLRARMQQLTLRGDPLKAAWQLDRFDADAQLQKRGDGYQLELTSVKLADETDLWQPGALSLVWNEQGEQDWSVALHDMAISPLTSLLLKLPWQGNDQWLSFADHLGALQPSGSVDRLTLRGANRGVDGLSVRFRDIEIASDGVRPGVSGLTGWLSGDASSGAGQLDSANMALVLPAQFDQPLQAALDGSFRWHHDGEILRVETGWLNVANEDANGRALAGINWRREQVPELTLLAMLSDGNAASAARYIPLRRLAEGAADWLEQAFVAGNLEQAMVLHEGPVVIDPVRQQDRTLQMLYVGDNVSLNFLPDWPLITSLKARVLIDGRDIYGRDVSGQLMGATLENASVDIPEWRDGEAPDLIISGRLRGVGESINQLLHGTPLKDVMPDEVASWQLHDGEFDGHLLVYWPLQPEQDRATVRAMGQLSGMQLESESRRISVTDVRSDFYFDLHGGLELPAFHGTLFDGEIKGLVSTSGARTRVVWRGESDMKPLREWLGFDWLQPISGVMNYGATLSLPWRQSGPVRLRVDSTLEGVSIQAPAPFDKGERVVAPFRLELTADDRGQDIDVRYHNWFASRWLMSEGELRGGRIRLGGGAALRPDHAGLNVSGHLPALAVSAWIDRLRSGQGEGGWSGGPALDVSIGALDVYGFELDEVRLTAARGDDWSVGVRAANAQGRIDIPMGFTARGDMPLVVDIQGAALRRNQAEQTGTLSPIALPIMDVRIASMSIDDADMGRWQFAARPHTAGIVLEELDASWRGTALKGKLDWSVRQHLSESHFVGSLTSAHMGRTLNSWSLPPFVESDSMRAALDIRWPGSPTELDYLSLNGQASLAIGPGRFPRTDSKASALRVLGVFNMATVSRRLRLDFSDLYKKGLSFEEVSGDFTLNGNVIGTDNLQIKSPSAEFRLRGEMDMEGQTLDHYMEVTLPVSSNLYVGCLAGPAACAGIFVVERLWGERLEKMTSLGYQVSGSWDNPKVEEVQGMFDRRRGG